MNAQWLAALMPYKDSLVAVAALGALAMTALTAVLSLLGTIQAKRMDVDIQRQNAIRQLVAADMGAMGEAMHETLACADIMVKKFGLVAPPNSTNLATSIANYKAKIDDSKKVLISAKTTLRYKFHGLEDGLTSIARAADWCKGLKDDIPLANDLLKRASKIASIIDLEIVRAYRDGKYPRRRARWRIRYHVWRLEARWAKHKSA